MTVAELRAALEGIPDHTTVVLKDEYLKGAYFQPVQDVHVFEMIYLGDNIYTSRGDLEEPGEPEETVLIQ